MVFESVLNNKNGINPIRLISKPTHPINQESEEIVSREPVIRGIINICWLSFIKIIVRNLSISGLWAQ